MCDKHPRGQKRQQDSAGGAEKQKSAGGASQPASKEQRQVLDAAPEDKQEKRVARNNMAYTKDAFLAFYWSREYAEQEWDCAGRMGAVHLRRPCRFLSVVKPATLLSSPFISLPLYLCNQLLGDVPQLAVELGC